MSGYATRMHSAQLPSTAHRRASAGPLPATHNFHLQIPNWPIAELKVWCGVQVGRDEEVRIALNLEHYVPCLQDIEPARLQTMTMKRRRCW